MKRLALGLLVLGAVAGCSPASSPETAASAQTAAPSAGPAEKGGEEEWGPYEPTANWPQPLPDGPDGVKHDGWTWGSVGAVYAETPDRIWIAQRGELPMPKGSKDKPWTPYGMLQPPRTANGGDDADGTRGWERRYHHSIIVVDRTGKLVDHWPQAEAFFNHKGARGPHKIKMSPYDPEKHVWIFDDNLHQIHKFTYDGKLVMTLGERGKPGRDGNHFNRPTDIDWLPDGTFFISDGYVGTRVAKFDKDGKFLFDWGTAPKDPNNPGPNEFDTVHSIAISKDRKLYVSDRTHSRIQIFDENGKFLDMWPNIRSPYSLLMSADQHLWVSDGVTQKILKYDLNGKFLYGWGTAGNRLGNLDGPHQMSVDQDNNLYVADVFGGRVHRFHPKPGADAAKLVGPELRYSATPTN
jgi:sugar lactone lactonase YvrE